MTYTQNDKLLFTMYLVLFETERRTKTVEKLTKLIGSYFHKSGTYPKITNVGTSRIGNTMHRRDILDKPDYASLKTQIASMWRKHTTGRLISLGALLVSLEAYTEGKQPYSEKVMEKAHTAYYFSIEEKSPEDRAEVEKETEELAELLLKDLGYTVKSKLSTMKRIIEGNMILEKG